MNTDSGGDLYARVTDGQVRDAYLAAMTTSRRRLEGTRLLQRWDDWAREHPRTTLTHLRTMFAVHRAEDLVALDLPWWTYQAIDRVTGYLQARGGQADVFEYGAGASTLWLARRCASVTSVEHHPGWADRVRGMLAEAGLDNVEIIVPTVPTTTSPVVASAAPSGRDLDFADYVAVLDDHPGPYDLLAVDGRARATCLGVALEHADEHGMVLMDDAQRDRYQPALARAEVDGWTVDRNRGPAPCEPLRRETALMVRSRPA